MVWWVSASQTGDCNLLARLSYEFSFGIDDPSDVAVVGFDKMMSDMMDDITLVVKVIDVIYTNVVTGSSDHFLNIPLHIYLRCQFSFFLS